MTFTGGYMVFQMGTVAMGKARARFEREMQALHDQGRWKWFPTRVLENYHFAKGGTPMPNVDKENYEQLLRSKDEPGKDGTGLQYVFQKKNVD